MKNSENKSDKVIDKYYAELPEEVEKNMSPEETILSDKLNSAMNIMDILKTDTSTCDINILEIIEKGQAISTKKKNSLEFLAFMSLALMLILSLLLTTFCFGEKFFIYYELLTLILIPILIIPLAKLSKTGGN
jgi:hypothetical protein